MPIIQLTRGFVAEIDDDSMALIAPHEWCANFSNGGVYAVRAIRNPVTGESETLYMHRAIMAAQPGEYIDHLDLNTLNNRCGNLRRCTNSQNHANRAPRQGFQTKGVSYTKARAHLATPWQAYITVDRKRLHLGYFESSDEAQAVYNLAAVRHFGDFARPVMTA